MLLIILLLLQLLKAVYCKGTADNNCVSLAQSTVCSAFSQFYVGLPGLGSEYPFLINTTTIKEFDLRLLEYVNSTSDYLFPLGCLSSNYNPTIPYARYSLTRLCAELIQNPTYSLPCNFDYGLHPPPLCRQTCVEWVHSITEITENPRVCSDSVQRNDSLASYNDHCNTWEGFNGTIAENCISGIANEPYSCGFGNNTRVACHYCKLHSDDKCCQTVINCSRSLSAGAIVGIVIGCVVAIALLAVATAWYYYHKKKNHQHINPFQFISSASSSTASANNTSQPVNTTNMTMQDEATILKTRQFGNDEGAGQSPFTNAMLEVPNINNNINNESLAININTVGTPIEATASPVDEEFYVVIHPYSPQLPDELGLNVGDIVCLALRFDDGWALGFNVTTGAKGAFPLVCISPAPEESLGQLLNETSSIPEHDTNTATTTITTNSAASYRLPSVAFMNKIRDSVQRSLSLNSYDSNHNTNSHNHDDSNDNTIPKRSASYRSYEYFEVESPSSPTLHTPFFTTHDPHSVIQYQQQHQQHQQ
ncbi:MAG: hypothetical protein EXX96DRAFT_574457 [Benjaminiella poitrasii]|nr:MAG: hypothetical protein EXX96DRAFT_574457 [Benjaminiella poitrasii]